MARARFGGPLVFSLQAGSTWSTARLPRAPAARTVNAVHRSRRRSKEAWKLPSRLARTPTRRVSSSAAATYVTTTGSRAPNCLPPMTSGATEPRVREARRGDDAPCAGMAMISISTAATATRIEYLPLRMKT